MVCLHHQGKGRMLHHLSVESEKSSHLTSFMKQLAERRRGLMNVIQIAEQRGRYGMSMKTLDREEQTALWALRYLLGPGCWRRSMSLTGLLGREAERLQERFRALFLHAVCGTASLEYSTTEAHLLDILADMQNAPEEQKLHSELGEALMHLGLALAAYGHWLPVRKKEQAVMEKMPMPALAQDNYPEMMEAAE